MIKPPNNYFLHSKNHMIKYLWFYMLAIFLFSTVSIYGKSNSKVLIYYFKDISDKEAYIELTYRIPVYIHSKLKEHFNKNKVLLIDEEGMQLYREDRKAELWDERVLINIGKKKRIDEIIFGSFYIQNGKPVIIGRILYVESGLILNLTEERNKYIQAFKQVQNLEVDEILTFEIDKKAKEYRPPLSRIVESSFVRSQLVLHVSIGTIYPLAKWAELYPPGIFSEISIIHFPRINIFPGGLGINTNYIIMQSRSGEGYIDSSVMILSAGVSLQYLIKMRKIVEGIAFDGNFGLSISNLSINEESKTSVDPYIRAGINVIVRPFGFGQFSFKMGFFSIDYRENPMDAIYTEIGILI